MSSCFVLPSRQGEQLSFVPQGLVGAWEPLPQKVLDPLFMDLFFFESVSMNCSSFCIHFRTFADSKCSNFRAATCKDCAYSKPSASAIKWAARDVLFQSVDGRPLNFQLSNLEFLQTSLERVATTCHALTAISLGLLISIMKGGTLFSKLLHIFRKHRLPAVFRRLHILQKKWLATVILKANDGVRGCRR